MPLKATIEALVACAPPDATVPVRWLAELLSAETGPSLELVRTGDVDVDLTVQAVARLFGRAESTIRTWALAGRLPGAYRLRDREWRIPVASVRAMQTAEQSKRQQRPQSSSSRGTADLGAWRHHMPGAA